MQYLRNQWPDFKNSWSCLILTLLWIQWYTMYPLHLNYTITLPHKTITMKITIFHRGIFFGNTQIIMTNSPDLNPLDYHVWGAMLERKTFQPKPNITDELKKVLQTIWDDLPQNCINKAVLSFIKTSSLCESWGQTLWTSSNKLFSQGFELLASCDSLKCQISTFFLISIQAL